MKRIALFSVLALATAAFAIQQLDRNTSVRLTQIITGLLIGPDSVNTSDARINANRITRSLSTSSTIDFASTTIVCNDSTAITLLGARTGDTCSVGLPASPAANSSFSCYVSAANAVKVRHCPAGTAIDPASATYHVRVISNQ